MDKHINSTAFGGQKGQAQKIGKIPMFYEVN